jgi:hypothetical protein
MVESKNPVIKTEFYKYFKEEFISRYSIKGNYVSTYINLF